MFRPNHFSKISMRRTIMAGLCLLAICVGLAFTSQPAQGQVCNLKVVTDASPDYSDMQSMIHSITSKWQTPKEKCWAIFYWHHINRRQMPPMWVHGAELADPIMQWNDYGFTMCSTICGINNSVWGEMGFPVRHWEIQAHTVPEIFYDGRWHMYDSSMSCLYTLCDGVTIAGVEDIGKTQGCEVSGGKAEFAHIAKYHCLNATGKGEKALLTGADCPRELKQEGICFNPNKIQNCNDLWWDRGHRFILNMRDGEEYTRYYRSLGESSAYYTPNPHRGYKDPDHHVAHIRGNGVRVWRPDLSHLDKSSFSMLNVKSSASGPDGASAVQVAADKLGQNSEVVFKVEGANVITSLDIEADVFRKSAQDEVHVYIAPPVQRKAGENWKEIWSPTENGSQHLKINLGDSVNSQYAVLVKFELKPKASPQDVVVSNIKFTTVTQVNAKALPKLNIGKNVVYVGAGDQADSIMFWPDLRGNEYQKYAVSEQNVVTEKDHPQVRAGMHLKEALKPGNVVFKLDSPQDMTQIVYGGRLYNKGANSKITFEHSFDKGKTWTLDYTLEGNEKPWDVIKYVTVNDVPAKTRQAQFRYSFSSDSDKPEEVGLFNVRMEADYKRADEGAKPLDVTFTWKERQEDYSLVTRSHTQAVEKLPFKYEINVGGADHPVMESMRISVKGASGEQKYGYSDGKNAGGDKYAPFKMTYGTNFAEGKSYTISKPSATGWNAGDKEGEHKLTDGIAWCAYGGGVAYSYGLMWEAPKDVLITVDLEKAQKCGAFRMQVHGYAWFDAMKGEFPDKVEVLTSVDGKEFASQGSFNFNLRWKDLPADFMWPDTEEFQGHTFDLVLGKQVEARYVQFKVNSSRTFCTSEVLVLDSAKKEAFDLRIALPDEKAPAPATTSAPATSQPK